VLDGVFEDDKGAKRAGETVELEAEHGAYYVEAGLLEEVAEAKKATKK
jgi:hypothetical protein